MIKLRLVHRPILIWLLKWRKNMVTKYGMSKELGTIAYGENEEEVFLGRSVTKQQNMSEETAKKVDAEVKKIVDKGYERARKVLTEKIDDLHKLAKAFLFTKHYQEMR